jgi:hypothetical protein
MKPKSLWIVLSVWALVSLACAPSLLLDATPEVLATEAAPAVVEPQPAVVESQPAAVEPQPPAMETQPTVDSQATLTDSQWLTNALTETRWDGVDSDGSALHFYFMENGILEYANPNTYYRNGTWLIDGNILRVEMNNHFVDYTGTFDGSTINGSSKNVNGQAWTWKVDMTQRCSSFCGQDWTSVLNTTWESVGDKILWLHFDAGVLQFRTGSGKATDGSYAQDRGSLALTMPGYSGCNATFYQDIISIVCADGSSWDMKQVIGWW